MELSESVQKGLQSLADPSLFDLKTSSSATTCILEGVKQNVDKCTISLCLEDVRFDAERTYVFYITYQYRPIVCICSPLVNPYFGCPFSIGRCPPHINDVPWRLVYLIKNGHVHKVNEPSYLISLNVENTNNGGSSEEVHFSCTMEQLQDLVGKIKDAAKSIEGYAVVSLACSNSGIRFPT
ncbi:COMM domain-containing protein 3 [Oncorhynchus clarkii lewisi]|uniref:COMM domain-containing protein 3 n=1 Tax=Oncorhynchus clarkii lewisi TaxID=490388 RepID=UPI0039B9CFA4